MNTDNPLNFNTNPEPYWTEGKTTMKYDEVIPKSAEWYSQSYEFTIDWLKSICEEQRKPKSRQHRGMPYKRILKQWSRMYGENDLAEIVRCAHKIMDFIIKKNPQLKNHL